MVRVKRSRWSRTLAVPAFALAALVVFVPALSAATTSLPAVSPSPPIFLAASAVSSATVTWGGKDVSSANSPAAALSITKGQTIVVKFSFTESSASTVANVSLQMTYLGIVLTTSKATPQIVGGLPIAAVAGINWSFGPLYDALEGVFQFTASLLSPSGSTIWSETFYVFAKAPYLVESGAVVVLLVLLVAELYWGVSAIRDARRAARPPKTGPAAPGAPSSGAPPPTSGGATPPAGTPEAPAGAGPPAGPDSTGGGGGPP